MAYLKRYAIVIIQNDSELWEAFRSGDEIAFKQIYENELKYLYNYGRKLIREESRVEDTIHDLFVELWNRRQSIGSTDSIRKYLTVSFRRKLLSTQKKDQKIHLVDEMSDVTFDATLDVESIIIQGELTKEQTEQLSLAMQSLTDRQREILYLRFYQGLNYDQIAETLNIKYQSLRNTVSQAIKTLRDVMVVVTLLLFSRLIRS